MPGLRYFLLLASVLAAAGLTIAAASALGRLLPDQDGMTGAALLAVTLSLALLVRFRR